MKEKDSKNQIISFAVPIAYLLIWLLLMALAKFLGIEISTAFLLCSLVILFIGVISKSTSWSIGHDKFGIKGDTTSKKVEFCADGVGTIKIFDDNTEDSIKKMKEAGKVVEALKPK